MFITQDEAKIIVGIIKDSIADENAEIEIFADGGLDFYSPIENTGFSLHTASNGEVTRAFLYFKDSEEDSRLKNVHAYVVEYICDMDKYDFIGNLPYMLDDMSIRLEREVNKKVNEVLRRNR